MGLYYDNILMSNLLRWYKKLINNRHYILKTTGMIPWGRCLGGGEPEGCIQASLHNDVTRAFIDYFSIRLIGKTFK